MWDLYLIMYPLVIYQRVSTGMKHLAHGLQVGGQLPRTGYGWFHHSSQASSSHQSIALHDLGGRVLL
jgi:hypothetical protein